MKKRGILNAKLIEELTKLRHTDKMVICDAGFPIPENAAVADVSLVAGVPTVLQVLQAVLNEIIVEEYAVFDNMKDVNREYYDFIRSHFKEGHKSSEISMEEFRKMAADAKLYVRTGDLAPCANILLVSASGVGVLCDPLDVCFE